MRAVARVLPIARDGVIVRACYVALSAALLIVSFPPFSAGIVCAWAALVPLLLAIRGLSPMRAWVVGGAWALLANAGIFEWMRVAAGFRWYHFIGLDAVYSLLPAIWCGLVARMELERPRDLYAAAALWMIQEFVRTHAGFLALPLATIAHTQLDDTVMAQVAALLGEPALSFLVVLGNLVFYRWVIGGTSRSLLVATAPILVAAVFCGIVVVRADTQATHSVAVLDTHYIARGAHKLTNERRMEETLTALAGGAPHGAELVVLPESAFVNPQARHIAALRSFADSRDVALVFGVAQAAKFEQPITQRRRFAPDLRVSNAAWILVPGVPQPQRYEKVLRMPFAEYLPLAKWISWPRWLVGYPPEVIAGPGPRTFPVRNDMRVGVMICWEALIAAHARALARDGATVLVVIANDAWFGSDGAAALQGLAARMRAVETRRPVVLAANEGTSMLIDGFGRIVTSAAAGGTSAQWVRANVATDAVETLYARLGDVFVLVCALLVAGGYWRLFRPISRLSRIHGDSRRAKDSSRRSAHSPSHI